MRQRLLLTLTLLLALTGMARADEKPVLTIWLTSGEQVTYVAEERPEFKLVDDHLVVSSMSAYMEYEAKDVQKFTLDKEEIGTSITPATESTATKPLLKNGCLIIEKGKPYSTVAIFNINGINVANYTIDQDGRLNVDLSTLPSGTFVVKTSQSIMKLTKK